MTTRRNGWRWNVSASLLLAALLFRAYIPVGFMPATGTPFLLELCPAAGAVPQTNHQHHHHPQAHSHFQNCPFGSAPAPGPVSQLIVFQPPGRVLSCVVPPILPSRLTAQPLRSHQPRGPPSPV